MRKLALLSIPLLFTVAMYLIAYTNTSIALTVHLSHCDFPKSSNIKFSKRLSPWEMINRKDCYARASFEIESNDLRSWVENSDYEMIHSYDSAKDSMIFFQREEVNHRLNEVLALPQFVFQFRHDYEAVTLISIQQTENDSVIKCEARYTAT